jgi:hypothetical protein
MGLVMARGLTLNGFDELEKQLRELSDQKTINNTAKRAIYDGAGIVMDEVRANLEALPVSNDPHKGIRADQKRGLLAGLGAAKMRDDGGLISTKTGIEGYNDHKTKKYPNGQPNAMIARSYESGTTLNKAYHPFSRAIRAARQKALAAMQAKFDEEIKKHVN